MERERQKCDMVKIERTRRVGGKHARRKAWALQKDKGRNMLARDSLHATVKVETHQATCGVVCGCVCKALDGARVGEPNRCKSR